MFSFMFLLVLSVTKLLGRPFGSYDLTSCARTSRETPTLSCEKVDQNKIVLLTHDYTWSSGERGTVGLYVHGGEVLVGLSAVLHISAILGIVGAVKVNTCPRL